MKYKLAIADVLGVKVEGSITDDAGVQKPFSFVLQCHRLAHDVMKATVMDKQESIVDFFAKHARGWTGQRLVLDEEGAPAPFTPEALAVLFGIAGMANTCWTAYLNQVVVSAKN